MHRYTRFSVGILDANLNHDRKMAFDYSDLLPFTPKMTVLSYRYGLYFLVVPVAVL